MNSFQHACYGSGYISPEYAMGGIFSEKSDFYSFGVPVLEIVSGKKNTSLSYDGEDPNLLSYIRDNLK